MSPTLADPAYGHARPPAIHCSGMTCRSKSGLTDISPVKGWLWEAINTTQAAAPMVKMTMVMAAPDSLGNRTETFDSFESAPSSEEPKVSPALLIQAQR